jgi:exopolysaccharide biosynthesis polyprenyl glycosylphosphotransferase
MVMNFSFFARRRAVHDNIWSVVNAGNSGLFDTLAGPERRGQHDPRSAPTRRPKLDVRRHSMWVGSWSRSIDTLIALAVLVAIVIASNLRIGLADLREILALRISLKNALVVGGLVVLWPAVLKMSGAYDSMDGRTFRRVLATTLAGCALGSMMLVFALLTSNTGMLGVGTVPLFWIGTVVGTLAHRVGTRLLVARGREHSKPRRIVIAGTGARAAAVWSEMQRHPLIKYELVANADLPGAPVEATFAAGRTIAISDLEAFLMRTVVDEVVVALPVRSCYEEIAHVLRMCEHAGVHSLYLADAFSPTIARAEVSRSGGFAVVAMQVVRDDWRLFVKRTFDIVVAALMLALVSPLMIAITVAVKLTSPGPVFFVQERYGYRKRRFTMYKFRTMVSDAEARQAALEDMNEVDGPVFKIAKDPRVTPLGGFLRRTSLDELPQLWNILRGDMSVVGPRPLPIRDVSRFEEPWLMRRFSVQPGLTGLWQVSGRSNVGFSDWVKFDLQYIDSWSLMLDMQILLRTIPVVLRGMGAM